jgi:hypothetical protein
VWYLLNKSTLDLCGDLQIIFCHFSFVFSDVQFGQLKPAPCHFALWSVNFNHVDIIFSGKSIIGLRIFGFFEVGRVRLDSGSCVIFCAPNVNPDPDPSPRKSGPTRLCPFYFVLGKSGLQKYQVKKYNAGKNVFIFFCWTEPIPSFPCFLLPKFLSKNEWMAPI